MSVRSHRITPSGAALLAAACLTAAAAASLSGGTDRAFAAAGGRPNIVLIQSDDETRGQFTRKVMPNTKRLLADHGTSFRHYIATTAQCCPSRASLLTGQYAHNDGVTSNAVAYAGLLDKDNVLPVWLHQAGYLTMHVGKFLNGYQQFADPPSLVAPGWDQWYSFGGNLTRYYDYDLYVNGGVVHRGHRAAANATNVATNAALGLLRSYARRAQPFYLQLDEPAPHVAGQRDPFGGMCGHAAIPERRDERTFKHARLPRPPSFNEVNMTDKPSFLRSAPRLDRGAVNRDRRRWRCALGALQGVDRAVARVYRAIKRAGDLRRTVFIFISDNGFFYGQHRIVQGKVLPYDEALHLPLVIRAPKRYLDASPRVRKVRKTVGNIDLAPTILDLAHAQPCPVQGTCRTMDGRSLVPLLSRSSGWLPHRALLTEYSARSPGIYATCQFDGIVTRDDVYVRHSRAVDPSTGDCVSTDQRERYDVSRDPYELDNLCFAGRAANCPLDARQADLEARLSQLRDCAGIAGRDQQVGGRPFCE